MNANHRKKTVSVGVFRRQPLSAYHVRSQWHIGFNSLLVAMVSLLITLFAYSNNVFNVAYLRGLALEHIFSAALCSVLIGMACYHFWGLGRRSRFSIHLMPEEDAPHDLIILFKWKGYACLVGEYQKQPSKELPNIFIKMGCVASLLLFWLIHLDDRGFHKIQSLPQNILTTNSDFCPEDAFAELAQSEPKAGCELVLRAYDLGYTKDLGDCAIEDVALEQLSVCRKRRLDEPYLHFTARLLNQAVASITEKIHKQPIEQFEKALALQWQNIDALRDYQRYAMSAAPRASHHIWTNLPYPNPKVAQFFIDSFLPNHCLSIYQKQKNLASVRAGTDNQTSQYLQHVHGQLLFNPKVATTVGLCKEYHIHWQSPNDLCQRLAAEPEAILKKYNALQSVQSVLDRHDTTRQVVELERELKRLALQAGAEATENSVPDREGYTLKRPIDTSKIASTKRFREKDEVVSFHCFMQDSVDVLQTKRHRVTLNGASLDVRQVRFPISNDTSNQELSLYQYFAKTLSSQFHYSRFDSQSIGQAQVDVELNEQFGPQKMLSSNEFVLSNLALLEDQDIFLNGKWLLDEKGLLEVYPYHLHLQNYVEHFRLSYQQERGRL